MSTLYLKVSEKMVKPKVSVVIPAYNEATSIGEVVANCKAFCDEIIVVDDGSTDNTAEIAKNSGAAVVRNERNLGVTRTTQMGFEQTRGDIIVTMDADGQHDPSDIPKLIEPLMEGKAEVALGVRSEIPHRSERIINALTNLSVKCSDAGTGFRAIKADLAKKMKLHGTCLCGTFLLEAHKRGARIVEIPVQVKQRVSGKRKVRTRHVRQFFYVLKDLVF
jgi:glycosyltransferase involved in cell wall biosynthesis